MRVNRLRIVLQLQTFHPRRSSTSNINNHSIVTVISHANSKIIIPGDNEPPSWSELLEQPSFVKAASDTHLMIASHHGRKSGYHAELFDVVQPELCVISDGRVQDTDARARYSWHAEGWPVRRRGDGTTSDRKCLTTRSDGFIEITITMSPRGLTDMAVSVS